jgi:hypothetical protein
MSGRTSPACRLDELPVWVTFDLSLSLLSRPSRQRIRCDSWSGLRRMTSIRGQVFECEGHALPSQIVDTRLRVAPLQPTRVATPARWEAIRQHEGD